MIGVVHVQVYLSPASSHPQIRRKLEDVSAKLDILYNKVSPAKSIEIISTQYFVLQLRAGSLSGATLQGLHSILQHIWQYDYPACMQVLIIKNKIRRVVKLFSNTAFRNA